MAPLLTKKQQVSEQWTNGLVILMRRLYEGLIIKERGFLLGLSQTFAFINKCNIR